MSVDAFPFRLGHRPFLDGIRGIAIVMVLFSHTRQQLPGGHIGVNVFFVLSGFLITTILTEEWDRNGSIDFRRFYLRRVLRLYPALVALVAAVTGLTIAAEIAGVALDDSPQSVVWSSLAAIFYFANWIEAFHWFDLGTLEHTWSLSIEEQFYLVWPIALVAMLRAGWHRLTMIGVLVGLAVLAIALRGLAYGGPDDYARAYYGIEARADALLIGCVLSLVVTAGFIRDTVRTRFVLAIGAAVGVVGVAVVAATGGIREAWLYQSGGLAVTAIGTAMVMLRYLMDPAGTGNAVLSWPVLRWFGTISYGLYLWHVPVYRLVDKASLPTAVDLPLRIGLSVAAAVASYYLLERRFLRLKDRLPAARSPKAAAIPTQIAT